MPFFPCAHAGHPVWQHAVKQVVVQLQAQVSMQRLDGQPCLGLVYVAAAYAPRAGDIVAALAHALPDVAHWVGCAGHSVLAGDMDYGHAGALAVMLTYVAAQDYAVFSGVAPWRSAGFVPHAFLLHGDACAPQVARQVQRLQQQMPAAACMGAVSDLQTQHAQWSWGARTQGQLPLSIGGGGVQVGGLSGVAFSEQVACMLVGMQGCKPIGSAHTITRIDGDVVLELDGQPALEILFSGVDWREALMPHPAQVDEPSVRSAWVAMTPAGSYLAPSCLATDSRVLKVVGVDPLRQGIVLDGLPILGRSLTRCQYDEQAARTDMRRACAELWEVLTAPMALSTPSAASATLAGAPAGRSIGGAIYIRSQQRQRPAHQPRVDAELQLIRHALGPVPLLGFSSTAEIDGGELQHCSAQLWVFTQPLPSLV